VQFTYVELCVFDPCGVTIGTSLQYGITLLSILLSIPIIENEVISRKWEV